MELKRDKFRKARGGGSKILAISCAKCGHELFKYQKDGPGILKRLYLDRISPGKILPKNNLACKNCKEVLGVSMIYKKESRPALRLFAGSVSKKTVSSNK